MDFFFCNIFKSRCDPCQPGGVFPHIVEFGDFRGGVAQKIGYLTPCQRLDCVIRLFYSINQRGGEGVAERVKAFSLNPAASKMR